MGRIRTVKPSFWKHELLSQLPESTHMLAAALLNYADDHGYFNANVGLIKAECAPLRNPLVTITESLDQLSAIGYLKLGRVSDGRRYGKVVAFDSHQKVNRPAASVIEKLHITWENELIKEGKTDHTQITDQSVTEEEEEEEEEEEGNGKAEGVKPQEVKFIPNEPMKPVALAPEMVAKAVQIEAGVFGIKPLVILTEVCKREMDFGISPDEVKSALVRAWQVFRAAAPQLEYVWGAEKFYGEGHWKSEAEWPWKEGTNGRTTKDQAGRVSASEQRERYNLTNLANIAARRYGVGPFAHDGANDGTVPEPADSGSNAGDVHRGMGRDGSKVQSPDLPGRVIEGHP
jgi:hypothetical protein